VLPNPAPEIEAPPQKKEEPPSSPEPEPSPEQPESSSVGMEPELAEELKGQWAELAQKVGAAMPLARMYLKQSELLGVEKGRLCIGLPPRHAPAIPKLEQGAVRATLEDTLGKLLGTSIGVTFAVLDHDPALEAELDSPKEVEPLPPQDRTTLRDWHDDPIVRRTLEIFHGDIIDVTKE